MQPSRDPNPLPEEADIVVVGFGAAGLSATLSALDEAVARQMPALSVITLERAPKDDRGGNTRWSTAGIHPTPETDEFRRSFEGRSEGAAEYVRVLSARGSETLEWLGQYGAEFVPGPRTFMTSETPDLQPVGGGGGIVSALGSTVDTFARRGRFHGPDNSHWAAVAPSYETSAVDVVMGADGCVAGVVVLDRHGRRQTIATRAIILACGGFEGSPEMMVEHVGYSVVPTSRGGTYNTGEGIRMALRVGAKATGQWDQFHPLPADPRTRRDGVGLLTFAAVMETVPYSIMVNRGGVRFMDEGAHTMDELYDVVARSVQSQQDQVGYAVFDAQTFSIPGYVEAVAKDKLEDPYQADTLEGLAEQIGVDAAALVDTVTKYNQAVVDGAFDPFGPDTCSTVGLEPPKSHWARRIEKAPFYAYPVTCSIVFTFGGIGTNEHAEVVDADGTVIPGLYAAGEITGLYHRDYVGTTAVLRSLVFGRVAGERAARYIDELGCGENDKR